MDNLPPPIDPGLPPLTPVTPPAGSPDAARRAGAGPAASPAAQSAKAAPKVRPQVEALEFVDDGGEAASVTLRRPFDRKGVRVATITVRRLITQELVDLVAGGTVPDLYDAYALMTGLPAAVLRGLDADDGMAVAEAAFDFLPRTLAAAYSR